MMRFFPDRMIPEYPQFSAFTLESRATLHPLFQQLTDGISDLTFANLYLFRGMYQYQISKLADSVFIFAGQDHGQAFFLLPFGLPEKPVLDGLFRQFTHLKCLSETHATLLRQLGYVVTEDRDNFDYLYLQKDLAELSGRKFHKKRNLLKAFLNNYQYEGKPLLAEYIPDALAVLETWKQGRETPGDYVPAKEALERAETLQLCGGIYYVDGRPAAYSLGEELPQGASFAIHFEKAVGEYKGIFQFVNQAFASILPEKYIYINREQDLGDPGLRQAKESYNPIGFVKKYQAQLQSDE